VNYTTRGVYEWSATQLIVPAECGQNLHYQSDLYLGTKEKRYITERLEKYQIDENDNQTKMLG
jgi:hypothetical protein